MIRGDMTAEEMLEQMRLDGRECELEMLAEKADSDLPLLINRKWFSPEGEEEYLRRLKGG